MPRKPPLPPLPSVKNGDTTDFMELLKHNPVPVAILQFIANYQRALPHDGDLMMRSLEDATSPEKWSRISSKFGGTCVFCGGRFDEGDLVLWRRVKGKSYVSHYNCMYEAGPVAHMTDELLQESVDVLRKKLNDARGENRELKKRLMRYEARHDPDRT